MDRKLRFVFLTIAIITLFLVSSTVVLADPIADIFKSIGGIVTTNIQLPKFAFNSSPIQVPIYLVLALWIMIFSVIFTISKAYLPFFKNTESQGAVIAFSLAFSALAVFGTDLIYLIFTMLSDAVWTGYWFVVVAMVIFIIIGLYALVGKGALFASKVDKDMATASQSFADNAKVKTDAAKLQADNRQERAMLRDEQDTIRDLVQNSIPILSGQRNLKGYLEHLQQEIPQIARIGDSATMQKQKSKIEREAALMVPAVKKQRNLEQRRQQALARLARDLRLSAVLQKDNADIEAEILRLATTQFGKSNAASKQAANAEAAAAYRAEIKKNLNSLQTVKEELTALENQIKAHDDELMEIIERLVNNLHNGQWPQALQDTQAGITKIDESMLLDQKLLVLENQATDFITRCNQMQPTQARIDRYFK